MLIRKACANCGGQFMACKTNHVFCTNNCRLIAHRRKHKQPVEVVQAKLNLFSSYLDLISKLDDEQIVRAAMSLLIETPEENSQRKESKLYTLAKQKGLIPDAL